MQRLQQSGLTDQLALTPGAAATIADRDGTCLVNSAAVLIQQHWQEGGVLMVIGATGAVTRLIAPLLKDKESDPAVLVLDAEGQRVIPLLGGHQAGAEQLSREIAATLGGEAVLSGDSAVSGRLATDAFGHAWGWKRGGTSAQLDPTDEGPGAWRGDPVSSNRWGASCGKAVRPLKPASF